MGAVQSRAQRLEGAHLQTEGNMATQQHAAHLALVMAGGLALAGASLAQATPQEVAVVDGLEVTLHLHDFLQPEEVQILRQIAASAEAVLALLGGAGGHGAIAVAPVEGFLRDGQPGASATALGQLSDADTARSAALESCNAARRGGAACVVVMEAGPAR